MKRLVVLPFKKAIEIAFKNIRVRFFRSLITTLSLVLAVAFLSFTNVGTDVADGLLATGHIDSRQILRHAGYDIGPDDTSVAASPKQRWIVILSLVVCVVGIVNAQLMAVTERFREIGTMKCLGALDRFILRLFFLEAGMQGLVGGAAGALVGALFSLLNAARQLWCRCPDHPFLAGGFIFDPVSHRCGISSESRGGCLSGYRGGQDAAGGGHARGTLNRAAAATNFSAHRDPTK